MNTRYCISVLKSLLVFLMLFSVNLTGFAQDESGTPAGKPAVSQEIKDQLAILLPDAKKMNAEPDGEVEFYGQNLYELINGAAGIFHDYDFVALGHAMYLRGEADITVDIYFMGEPLNAFGVFSTEGSPDYKFIDLGAIGYLEEGILNFYQGPYYVKLSSFSNDGKTEALLMDFAKDVSSRIKDGKTLPALLTYLPQKNIVAHSQGFSKKAPLGYQFLAPALTAEYAFGDDRTNLVISMAEDAKDASARVKQMRENVAKSGAAADYPEGGPDAFRGKDKYRGEIIGFVFGGEDQPHYAVFVVKPPQDVDAFLKQVKESLNPKKEK